MLLEWVVPPECPSEHEVVAHVTNLAGEAAVEQPVGVWARIVRVEGRVEAPSAARRFRLELRIGNADEAPRVLESHECRKLAEATAFIVALDLQSRAESSRSKARPPDTPPGEPPPPTSTVRRRTPASPRSPRSTPPPSHGGLGAELVLDHGSLPSVGWTGAIFGFVTYGRLRGELGGALWPRNRATFSSAAFPDAGASIFLRSLNARACVSPIKSGWVDVCLRGEGGWLRSSGFGIIRPASSSGTWFTALAGLTFRPLERGPVRLRTTLEVGVPLARPEVSIEGIGRIYEPDPVVVRLGLGIETELF